MLGLDGNGEGGGEPGGIVLNHHGNAQLLQPFADDGHADQAPGLPGHEIDGLRRNLLRGHGQVALVLPAFIINDDDDLAGLDVFDRFRNR